jgi:hypothetical protein
VLFYLAWIGTASEQRNSQVQYAIDGQFKTTYISNKEFGKAKTWLSDHKRLEQLGHAER